ncbi:hypothetical protein H6A32_13015 [Drancourtella massiliensis]|uniref:Gp58-like domain-containing protein n=1 Tax=Drancourtella massiliensis TaxID=1632013 RepID=A0ABS2EJI3_9FIRM|nr:hypothetical protein [Drancourtella massiliensis]MBM6745205.1 hypothetical protein [Drancourtella massiliensis]
MRFEREINIYGDETVLKRFQAAETSISAVQGKISAMISESELTELENSNATMYSKLASAIMEIDALTINFSDLTTKYNTVSGQYSALNSKVATYKASVDELSADISSVQQNLSKNYSTTTQMNSAINAKANEISAKISSVETTLKNNYSTTNEMNSAINAKANEITTSVSSLYARKSEINIANGKINDLEIWKKSAEVKITDSAIVSTVTESSTYRNSVNSLIEQKASSIRLKADRISWESTYSSMTANGTLTCRNATIEGTIHSDNGDDEIYIRSARLDFIRDGVDVGNIGTNIYYNNNALKGLTFDLDHTGSYMAWGAKRSASESTFLMKWAYASDDVGRYGANTLNAGCDIDMHNYSIKNVWLSGIVAPNGYNGWTGEIPIYYKKGDSYYTSSITVSNGIITSAPRM